MTMESTEVMNNNDLRRKIWSYLRKPTFNPIMAFYKKQNPKLTYGEITKSLKNNVKNYQDPLSLLSSSGGKTLQELLQQYDEKRKLI